MPLSNAGYTIKTFEQIRDEWIADLEGQHGIKILDESTLDILATVAAERERKVYEESEDVYGSQYKGARGASLDNALGLTGVRRPEARRSVGTATATGTNGVVIQIGNVFRDTTTGARWRFTGSGTIATGSVTLPVESEDYGAIPGLTSGTYEKVSGPSGWTGVTMATNAVPGRTLATDAEYREAHTDALEDDETTTAQALPIRTAIEKVSGVRSANVTINNTDSTVDGVAAHATRAVVDGGADLDVAIAYWNSMRFGGRTSGATAVVVTDTQGDSHTVNIDRPTDVPIFVDITATTNSLYPADGDDQVKARIEAYFAALRVGQRVSYLDLLVDIKSTVAGIVTLTVELGTSEGTETVADITIAADELASVDVDNDVDLAIT